MTISERASKAIRIWLISATMTFATVFAPAHAQPSWPEILYFEPLKIPDLTTGSFELSVFGRQFGVIVTRNDALLSRLPSSQRTAGSHIELWKGELEGLPDSWVRITRRGRYFSGVVWDGAVLYAIEPYSSAKSRLLTPDVAPTSELIVYQLYESSSLTQDLVLRDKSRPNQSNKIGPDADAISSSSLTYSPVLEIDVGLIGDTDYSQFAELSLGSDATLELLSIANILDGIFLSQVGLRIRVAELVVFSSEPDGFSRADPSELLSEVAQFKGSRPAWAPLAIAHLVTGRELEESGSNEIIGIANIGSTCDAYDSVSLTQGTFASARTALIAAHEIAHNLGAPHDAETGSVCEAESSGFLMDPYISVNDEFSQCSINQIQAHLATATCARPVPNVDVSVTSLGTRVDVLAGWSHSASFRVDNNGLSDAYGIEIVLQTSPEMTIDDPEFREPDGLRCEQDLRTKTCMLDVLPAGESIYLGHYQTAVAIGTATTTATITSANDTDLTNNTATYVLEVLPAVKLSVVDFAKSTEVARPGQIVNLTMELLNDGVVDATNVDLSLWLPDFFELESAELPQAGSCSPSPPLGNTCQIAILPAGEPQFVDLQLRVLELDTGFDQVTSGTLRARIVATERDANENSWWSTSFFATQVLADVELTLDAPASGIIAETAEFTFNITNQGPDTVPSMYFDFSNTRMEIDNLDALGAECVIGSESTDFECDIGPVSANETLVLTVSGVPERTGRFTVSYSLSADAFSFDPVENADSYSWSVTSVSTDPPPSTPSPPTPQPSKPPASGGGGSFGPLTLLFLFLSFVLDSRLNLLSGSGRSRSIC